MYWNSSKECLDIKGSGVDLNVGEEIYYPKRTHNHIGPLIPNGTPVMVDPTAHVDSEGFDIIPAVSDGTVEPANYLGLATENIPTGEFGRVTYFGQVNDVPTAAWHNGVYELAPLGSVLYVDPNNPGQFTIDAPSSPNYAIVAGRVTKVSSSINSNDGSIFVRYESRDRAFEVNFDPLESGLSATNVQSAIDELQVRKADISLLSSNITLFATTSDSDIPGYNKLVTAVDDPSYDTDSVDVSTPNITTNDQIVGALIADPGLWVGSLPYINVPTVGDIAKISGNKNNFCAFYFKLFKRSTSGVETEVATSDTTSVINPDDTNYREFSASAILDNTWVDSDRLVIKFYATNVSNVGGELIYNFRFGGSTPVRTLLPVPVSVIPSADASGVIVNTSNFSGLLLTQSDDTVQKALDTLDNHEHDDRYVSLNSSQDINGLKNFTTKPTVNGVNILLDGEGGTSNLSDLEDVSITDATDNQALVYNNGLWVNTTLNLAYLPLTGGSLTGSLNVSNDIYSNEKRVIVSDDVNTIVKLTQAEYNTITPDPSTLYIITDEDIYAPFIKSLRTVTSNSQVNNNDYTILCNGTLSLTLPAATANGGYVYNIKNIGTGDVTVNTYGGNIDGSESYIISAQYASITVQSDGLNWYII